MSLVAFNKKAILERMILVLSEEFENIKNELKATKNEKVKIAFRNNLFRCAELIINLYELLEAATAAEIFSIITTEDASTDNPSSI